MSIYVIGTRDVKLRKDRSDDFNLRATARAHSVLIVVELYPILRKGDGDCSWGSCPQPIVGAVTIGKLGPVLRLRHAQLPCMREPHGAAGIWVFPGVVDVRIAEEVQTPL